MNRLLIAGTSSGCGKTTVTCAILSAFVSRGFSLTAFKCGPDYIDPMFHRETAAIKAYNLDPFFLDETQLCRHLANYAGRDLSIIEGAMGYYDGIANTTQASAYTVAKVTRTPVVLVVNVRKTGNSIAAVLEGFKMHRPDSGIKGVIFNAITADRYRDMAELSRNSGLIPLGYLPFDKQNSVESRHLGLTTAGEIEDLRQKLARLGETASKTLDLDGLLQISSEAPVLSEDVPAPAREPARVKIAVSRDKAFCFTYCEALELFESCGAELLYFSPLKDSKLPENIQGLYLCGGYPELYAKELSQNRQMLSDIKASADAGLPIIAECGGFMVLHDTLDGYPMACVIKGDTFKTERLQRFGYTTLTAKEDNLLCEKGAQLKAHEFHYWDSENSGGGFTAQKAGRDTGYPCVHASDTMYAGFPHIYFTQETARRFVDKASRFKET